MLETTDTSSSFDLIPEGRYKLKVLGKPAKYKTNKSTYRKWIFIASKDGIKGTKITVILFPWESHDILLAIGGTQNPDNPKKVDWDDDEVDGRQFEADLSHAEYNKKDGTKGKKYVFTNVVEAIPF